jgi:hypothetical protein
LTIQSIRLILKLKIIERFFMKTPTFQKIMAVAVAAGLMLAGNVRAQNYPASAQLSYGTAEVVKLAQAKVSDDTIIAYINTSGNNYNLSADQVLYLRQQGVSDTVITTMLNHAAAPAAAPATPAPQPVVSTVTPAPTVTYIQTAPPTYYYQPYYYPAPVYGWSPALSLSFGFGGHWGGGWHGGGWRR